MPVAPPMSVIRSKNKWRNDTGLELHIDVLSDDLADVYVSFKNEPGAEAWRLMNIGKSIVTIEPFKVIVGKPLRFESKYGPLGAIHLEERFSIGFSIPQNEDDVLNLLDELPVFIDKKIADGLGFRSKDRFIADALRRVGFKAIHIHHDNSAPRREGAAYVVGEKTLSRVSKAMARTHSGYSSRSNNERFAFAHNELLHPISPTEFGTFAVPNYDLVKGANYDRQGKLNKAGGRALAEAVKSAASDMAVNDQTALLAIKSEAEVVTLERLIDEVGKMMAKGHGETAWQKFFEQNSFVLSLAFSVPIVYIESTPHVGNTAFDGSGDKKSDFLMKAASTGNVSIVEIKSPKEKLLSAKTYRGLKPPASNIIGAVTQVLNQRAELYKTFNNKVTPGSKYESLRSYAIQCYLIAGTLPAEEAERSSFEIYRNAVKDVHIVTFDELMLRLNVLRDVLKGSAEIIQSPKVSQEGLGRTAAKKVARRTVTPKAS